MNVGIIGAGNIARKMVETLHNMTTATAYAIASRSADKATLFAKEFHVPNAYGNYESMLDDPAIDLVYIATPHSHHYEHALLALHHNKPILVEKSFMVNEKQAKEIISLGKEKNLLVAEAIWTRYMPSRYILNDLLHNKVIGDVYSLTANLGYKIDHVPRIYMPELAGGALLDLGVYTLNFASMVLGTSIDTITSTALLTKTNVDKLHSITLNFTSGQMAILHSTIMSNTNRQGVIYGTNGMILVDNINNIQDIRVYDLEGNLLEQPFIPKQITGFEYQVEACRKALEQGTIEVPDMPHDEILRMMHIMDSLRKEWGVSYPSLENL